MQFNEMNILPAILKAIEEEGYNTPTPIQAEAIPQVLKGSDILGCAQTGTGKTAAFSIPILQLLSNQIRHSKNPRALILTPTRELAIQIGESLDAYGRHLPLKNTVIFGGVSQHGQVNELKKGIHILVATPGRLLDLMMQGLISLLDVEIFVLDEADRMLDMGFIHDVKKVIKALPEKRQNLFFSATIAPEILKLAGTILEDPIKVEVTPVSSTADKIGQKVYFVDKINKPALLVDIFNSQEAKSALVFTRTKYGADKVAKHLNRNGIKADAIHGDKSQLKRQKALNDFKEHKIEVLVATDIAARGIDIEQMELVINYELPNIPETYVHRIGRTGRAGHSGKAISFCDFEEKAYLKDIEKLIKQSVPVSDEHSYPMEVFEIIKKEKTPRPPRVHQQKDKPTKEEKVVSAKNKGKKTWFGKRNRY
jgi:ATP-dependent RNA helicase RhlE